MMKKSRIVKIIKEEINRLLREESNLGDPFPPVELFVERAQQVLHIISPKTRPSMRIEMTVESQPRATPEGQNMKLNGVQVPPKFIDFILNGGPRPK